MEGVVGGCEGVGWMGDVLVGGFVVALYVNQFLIELADFDPSGVELVEGEVVEGFENMKIDFFGVFAGVVGGGVVDEETFGQFGEALRA